MTRGMMSIHQVAARVWMTAAAASLLIPSERRLGLWLPLHLALAGAVSVAISGAMAQFASALTASRDPSRRATIAQVVCLNVGAAVVAFAHPTRHPAAVAAGGALFGLAMILLAGIVAGMWRTSINRRHPVPMLAYALALASILAGVTVGALLGGGLVSGSAWLALRQAHIVLNVLGFAGLTILGTMLTLLPTLLRVPMPAWRPQWVVVGVGLGVAALASGLGSRTGAAAVAGAMLIAAGGLGAGVLAAQVLMKPRRHFVPTAARHLLAGIAWLIGGAVAVAARLAFAGDPVIAFASMRETVLVTFVAGWTLQVLLGAWLYLLPARHPATPAERRVLLASVELGGLPEVVMLNLGLALLALRPAGVHLETLGAVAAGAGAAVALAKAWLYGPIAKTGAARMRATALWGAGESGPRA